MAIPPNTLFQEASCYNCASNASLADLLRLALWSRIAGGGGPTDPVTSFIDRAGITNPTQIAAITELYNNAVEHGWWEKCDLIYPFVGGNATAHAQNLKSSNFTIAWHGTVTHNANGITGNGSTGYGDTGYTPSASPLMQLNSAHVGIYRRTIGSGPYCGGATIRMSKGPPFQGPVIEGFLNSGTGDLYNVADALTNVILTRTDAVNAVMYVAGNAVSQARASTSLPSITQYVLSSNINGSPSGFQSANLAGLTAGSGLLAAEAHQMNTDWQNFQTSLGRQV